MPLIFKHFLLHYRAKGEKVNIIYYTIVQKSIQLIKSFNNLVEIFFTNYM